MLGRLLKRAPNCDSLRSLPRPRRLYIDRLEERRLLSAIGLSTSSWTPIGPAPLLSPNQEPITGRVDEALPDPRSPNVMYIASDAGGVWKTNNWLDSSPHWVPLTDSQSSLQFAGYHPLAMSASNPDVLYAGMTGPGGGILKSTNAGASWNMQATGQFGDVQIWAVQVSPTDPNTLFAALRSSGVAGTAPGVWKSTDGGANWSNTTSALSAAATDVVIDPNQANVVYAGLIGNNSTSGIYRSADSGGHWTRLGSGLPSTSSIGDAIHLAMSPASSATVYATVFDRSLGNGNTGVPSRFKSTDSGTTWSSLAALPASSENRSWHVVLAVSPTNSQVVYANGAYSVFQSSNGGSSWSNITPLDSKDPVGVFFDANNSPILVADRGIAQLPQSGIAGSKAGDLQNALFYTLTADPHQPDVVYGVAQDQFWALKFSGSTTWQLTRGGSEVGRVRVDPLNSNRVYVFSPLVDAGDPSPSFFFRSDDGGQTWAGKGSGIPTVAEDFRLAYSVQRAFVVDPSNSSHLLVGTNAIYESNDGAESWHLLASFGGQPKIRSLAIGGATGSTVYASTADGHFWRSDDGGHNWATRDIPGIAAGQQVVDIVADPTFPLDVGVVLNDRNGFKAFGSVDGGSSWINFTGNLPQSYDALCVNVDWYNLIFYVGTSRGLLESRDFGTTWIPLAAGLPNTNVTDISLVPVGLHSSRLSVGTFGRGAWQILVDADAPSATINAVPDVTAAGGLIQVISVDYTDALSAIDVSSLDSSDLVVTGSNGFSSPVDFVSWSPLAGGGVRAVYRFAAPQGSWDAGDNASYTISLNTNQVFDLSGNPAGAASRVFNTAIPPGLIAIPVANSGFEQPTRADGTWFPDVEPTGWTKSGGIVGVENWLDREYPGATEGGAPSTVPEGLNAAYVRYDGAYLRQVLTGNLLLANSRYYLAVDVGHRLDDANFPGYRVELWAGGTPLMPSPTNLPTPGFGEFRTASQVYEIGDSTSGIGQTLEIRLYATGALANVGQVNFDLVRLFRQSSAAPGLPDLPANDDTAFDQFHPNFDPNHPIYFGSRSDNITADALPSFSVPGTIPGADVSLYIDGALQYTQLASGSSTFFSPNWPNLSDGVHSITARQQEPGKPPSAFSPTLQVRIDTTPPSPASNLQLSPAVNVLGWLRTNVLQPVVSWTPGSDSGSGLAGHVVLSNPPLSNTFVPVNTNSNTLALDTSLGVGATQVLACDLAGNVAAAGSSPELDFLIDTVPPTVTATTPQNGAVVATGPSEILVDFSEPLWEEALVLASDLTLSGPGLGTIVVTGASFVDADTARFTLTGTWGAGQVNLAMSAGYPRDLAGVIMRK